MQPTAEDNLLSVIFILILFRRKLSLRIIELSS